MNSSLLISLIGLFIIVFVLFYIFPFVFRVVSQKRLFEVVRRRRMVCLTFDDGPSPGLTPRILEALHELDAPATFYLIGAKAVGAAEEHVRSDAKREIASHSLTHANALKSSPWRVYTDTVAGHRVVTNRFGPTKRFRPPYGKVNLGSLLAARRIGVEVDWWTIDTGDTWASMPDPSSIADRIVRQGGGVVLLHDIDWQRPDGCDHAEFVLQTTRLVITRAREAGLRFGTMSELKKCCSDDA